MKKLRAPTRKPLVMTPIWPNVGVERWYQIQLDKMITASSAELRDALMRAWRETPPLFAGDAALEVQADAAGVMFRTPDNRVLLLHRNDGEGWAFPGGTIEENETAEAAARREAFEETLHPCNGFLELLECRNRDGFRFATFVCDVLEPFEPTLNSEHSEYIWMEPAEAIRLIKAPFGLVNAHFLHVGVRATLAGYNATQVHPLAEDAPSSTKALQALLAKWGSQSIKRFDLAANTLADSFAGRSTQATQAAMMSQLKAAGFTVAFKPTQRGIEAYRAVAAENVGLIKSIPRKWHEQIEQKVWNAVRNGSDLHTLSIELNQSYGSTVKRAALIARDQNAKAKAVIERVRQQELGITRGIWMHSHAGKEPRPTHVAMNDKPYDLAQGMWDSDEGEYVHPGQLINCRCSMRPVIDGAEEYSDDDEQPAIIQLITGLATAKEYKTQGRARAAEMRSELQMLRDQRTTWATPQEMQLRTEIDSFLRGG